MSQFTQDQSDIITRSDSTTGELEANSFNLLDNMAIFTSSFGSIYFDILLPAGISHEKRMQIRRKIRGCIRHLIGPKTNIRGLAKYMSYGLTSLKDPLSADPIGMLRSLNAQPDGYLRKIARKCASENIDTNGTPLPQPINDYKATLDEEGVDLYCIGTDGRIFCYHFFELEPKTADIDAIFMPEGVKVRLCCVASFEK